MRADSPVRRTESAGLGPVAAPFGSLPERGPARAPVSWIELGEVAVDGGGDRRLAARDRLLPRGNQRRKRVFAAAGARLRGAQCVKAGGRGFVIGFGGAPELLDRLRPAALIGVDASEMEA